MQNKFNHQFSDWSELSFDRNYKDGTIVNVAFGSEELIYKLDRTSTATVNSISAAGGPGTVAHAGISGVGRWHLQYNGPVKPEWFGVQFDGSDEGDLFNAFLSEMATLDYGDVAIYGDLATSVPIVWDGSTTHNWDMGLNISTLAPISGAVLNINNHTANTIKGKIAVTGDGGSNPSARTADTGVLFTNCRAAKFEAFDVSEFRRFGIDTNDETGNNTLLDMGSITAYDCGDTVSSHINATTANWSSGVNVGGANSTLQYTTIQVDSLPVDGAKYCIIEGNLHHIRPSGITGTSINVYPWVGSAVAPSGTLTYLGGGGVRLQGSDAANININKLDAQRCGIALDCSSLYGPAVKRGVFQSVGVGVSFARGTANAHLGSDLRNLYFESNDYDIVQLTSADIQSTIEGISPINYSKVKAFAPAVTSGALYTLWTRLRGLSIIDGRPLYQQPNRPVGTTGIPENASIETLTNSDDTYYLYRDAAIVSLDFDDDMNRLFGYTGIEFYHFGTNAGDAPTTLIIGAADPSGTINGGASATFSQNGPRKYVAVKVGDDWRVHAVDGSPPSVATIGDNPSTVDFSASDYQSTTLTSNTVSTFVDPVSPRKVVLQHTQDAGGGNYVSFSGIDFNGAAPYIDQGSSAVTVSELWFDGASYTHLNKAPLGTKKETVFAPSGTVTLDWTNGQGDFKILNLSGNTVVELGYSVPGRPAADESIVGLLKANLNGFNINFGSSWTNPPTIETGIPVMITLES